MKDFLEKIGYGWLFLLIGVAIAGYGHYNWFCYGVFILSTLHILPLLLAESIKIGNKYIKFGIFVLSVTAGAISGGLLFHDIFASILGGIVLGSIWLFRIYIVLFRYRNGFN